jgi:vitamin B12 transporter
MEGAMNLRTRFRVSAPGIDLGDAVSKSFSFSAAVAVAMIGLMPARAAYAAAADAAAAGADEVVVTATRIPTPESQVASSISIITGDEIEARQLQTLPDVLKDVPGLNVVRSGGPGGQTSVFMRGTNSDHTKVFVDGIDVNDPSSPNASFDFGQFLTQDIAKVEVLRGPQSGLYGSDAIGGVINIITKSGSGPASVVARAEAGTFDTFNQSVGLAGSADGFHYTANIEHFHSGATPVTPLDLLTPGEQRIDDYYDNRTASTKLGLNLSDDFDLGLVGRYTDTHLRNTGENFATFPGTPDSAQSAYHTRQYYTRGTAHLALFDGHFEQTLGVAYSNLESSSTTPDGPPSDYSGNRLKLDWQGNAQLTRDEILVLGAEHQKDEITNPISAGTSIDSGYAELQSAVAGVFFNSLSVRYDANDRFGSKVTYRFAPAYLIGATGTKLKASVGSGFKAPTLSEMFQNFPNFGFFGNPNLRPETSVGYDLGFEQRLADSVQFGATYFRNNIKNLITDNADFTSYANVGRAVTDGVESFASYQPMQALTLRADYTFTQAYDDILHEVLLRRPKHKASVMAEWRPTGKLSIAPSVLYVGSWIDGNRDFSVPRLTAGGYTVANVAASYDLTDTLSIFGRVDNLTGRHYEEPVGFLQPSRGVYAGVKARF